jgi:hypothetical protein
MFDLNALNTAIVAKVGGTVALSSIAGKTAFGYIAPGTSRPKCRFSVVGDASNGSYEGMMLSTIRMQFSIFADDISTATGLAKSLGTAFHRVQLTLSSGTNVASKVIEGWRLIPEGEKPEAMVYHAIAIVEFMVLS